MKPLALSLSIAAAALAAPALAKPTVITADRYLDVAKGAYVEYPAIFVDDSGRITNIADARTIKLSGDVERIDLSGKTLVPGFIDMHVHLDGPADIGGYRGLEFTDSFFAMTAVGNARAMLDAGLERIHEWKSELPDCAALSISLNLGGYRPSGPAQSGLERHVGLSRMNPVPWRAARPR